MSRLVRFISQSEYFKDVFIISSDTNKKALALTVGFYLAIFPLPGTVTLLCIMVSFVFRLNLVLLQGMNWLLTPLQAALFFPFLKTGRLLFFSDKKALPIFLPESLAEAKSAETIFHVIESLAGGILVWGLVSLATGYFLFRLLLKTMSAGSDASHLHQTKRMN
jgi:uncharacterized protein (DUF2062 family)